VIKIRKRSLKVLKMREEADFDFYSPGDAEAVLKGHLHPCLDTVDEEGSTFKFNSHQWTNRNSGQVYDQPVTNSLDNVVFRE